MRIISGKHKGRRITAPKRLPVRPTTDMAKEGLFNILSNRYSFETLKVLDLFAGTGNISFEFASRGVARITAVDANTHCVQFINKVAKELDEQIAVFKANVFQFLNRHKSRYDIIFADPPYAMPLSDFLKLPELIFEQELLEEGGIVIVEHAVQMELSNSPYFREQRKYGSSVFSFFAVEEQ